MHQGRHYDKDGIDIIDSVELAVREIHLWMLSHERFESILFFLLVTCRFTQFLLSLIVHHLFHHSPRFSVQVGKLAVLGLNLLCVDLRVSGHQFVPPFHLVYLNKTQFI